MSETCDILKDAKQWLSEHTWQKGSLFGIEIPSDYHRNEVRGAFILSNDAVGISGGTARYDDPEQVTHACALGAVYLATVRKLKTRDDQVILAHAEEATRELAKAMWEGSNLFGNPDSIDSYRVAITGFNDKSDTHEDDVLASFDRAIDKVCT